MNDMDSRTESQMGHRMKAVVIVVEGLGAMMLGPYGSSTSTTPALNRMAASGLLLDQCFLDSFDLATQLRSLWTATHASSTTRSAWNIWRAWQEAGVPAQLITDSPEVAELAQRYDIPQVTLVQVTAATEAAESAEECNLTQVFAAATELLASAEPVGVVWIHAQGLKHVWDAPLELREAMMDPEDPTPPSEVHLPEMELDEDSDPDVTLGWSQVAAAQVAVLDAAMDALEQTIANRTDVDQWSWLFCSLGGIPLGEHGTLGIVRESGYIEEIAVPVILRSTGNKIISTRRAELCQLPDLPVSLVAAMDLPVPGEVWGRNQFVYGPPLRSTHWSHEHTLAFIETGEHTWLRTPAWSFMLSAANDPGDCELYVKPDDRWEVSDIASRGTDIVEQLQTLLPQVREAVACGKRELLPRLNEELTSLIRN